ncbi:MULTISPECIES: helicase-related protein [Nocardiaceae]|uniref:DEAD/DEAH box helicase family protein n=1 Tax=Rhodococcoides kroppenstedtii TaxID=293050 RepID=A0ABS7NTZ8_9NOCA|nr:MULTISPECIES: helicase-related protein [Rhodococcus]AMY20774.1 RNA polymerase-associated protein RapA [Rhodococcus sp. PBTS 1]MBY6313538.1 DEAD/DEAH box helicase family protein [Rhodococcus kroppenstedtii]MBY6321456.1 DEAD/DEAH box helicase family protein [Rhodococcus kroppenstedtii]MBY6400154.1 DEAD/DEAH box helicase family protein [Rhodococcus kroppenstedtii]
MRSIDNVNDLLGDDLKTEITPGAKVRIAASTFSIFAFEALRKKLEQVSELEFIFTSPSFVTEKVTDRLRKERREFFIPGGHAESSLYGSDFEIRLRNKLTQRAIAKECADWVRRKVTFRSNATGNPMQQLAVVDETAAYFPIQGFTTADLGYERGPAVSNMSTKFEGAPETRHLLDIFDQIWNNPDQLDDVTQAVHDHIASVYAENSPARIYFLILYNLFAEFLDDINEDVLPNDRTGYQDTKVWQSLYNFQRDAATGVINKLETYNGCILADSVGLGKTFTALAVIKYYELRNKSVLVLCPKKLAENWTNYNANLTTNIFAGDRFNYDVLAHTDLSRTRGESMGLRLDRINWGNYDLVVIDESHNFRNADYSGERESRYQRLMRQVIREGVKTKVLMLSATPVNNKFSDLKNQLQLAYEGESDNLAKHLRISTTVEKVFKDAQTVFNAWSKLDAEDRTTDRILQMLDFDFFELLDSVTIARSRKHIQAFYDTSKVGVFPKRLPPRSIRQPLTDLDDVPTFDEIFEQLQQLTLAVYTPLAYVFPSRLQKYEDLYNVGTAGGKANLGQQGREQGLKKLMTVNLLKRLESSVDAFRLTLTKIEGTVDRTLGRLEGRQGSLTDMDVDLDDLEVDEEDAADAEALVFGDKIKIDLEDIDVDSWQRDLWNDRETLHRLLMEMHKVTPERDLKLRALKDLIADKAANPINDGNRKVLIFSAFADTANYLYRELGPEWSRDGMELGLVTGGGNGAKTTIGTGYDFQEVLTLFSPRSKQRHLTMPKETIEIDVLIGTDVISEGQNLQDCDYLVNYDIHWNPVRIIQRFGRVDRIGSTNTHIQLVNFWPDISLDEYIKLKERVENRMVIADLAGTADDNVLTLEDSDVAFRKEQLRKLQDEVIELEDVRTGVSITDLGLNDFRMDLLGYLKEYGDLAAAPKGLHAVVPADPTRGLTPGVIFALRNVNADENINRGNRLHPHYLVYLGDDGTVVADHTEVKHLLDLIRAGCRPHDEPVADVVRIFNAATGEGANMDRYSELLTDAIHSMIDVTEERDIDSLFTGGHTTALAQTIAGLDDFELIAFIAVVDPDGEAPTDA